MVQFSGKPWYSKINWPIIFSKKSTINFLQKIAEKIKLLKIFLGGLCVQIKKMLITLNSNPLEAILQLLIGPERFLDLRAIQTSQRDAEKLKILLLTQKFRKKIDPKVYHMGLIWKLLGPRKRAWKRDWSTNYLERRKRVLSTNNLERSERLRKRVWSTNNLERSERLR